MDNASSQHKTSAILMQFLIFFTVTVSGMISGFEEIMQPAVVGLIIATIIGIRLIVICIRIHQNDGHGKIWNGFTLAIFIAALLIGVALATDDGFYVGMFGLGVVGLVLTTLHFIIWKIAAFFWENTSTLSSKGAKKSHNTKDLSKEGKVYIVQFDKLYAEIPNFKKPPISKQANHLREAYIQVHDFLAKNSGLAHLANELNDYHFPQALKLLESYGSFTKKRVKVDNVKQILDNLVQSFDALSSAVDDQLNSLYAGMVLDVRTDKAVLENMSKK